MEALLPQQRPSWQHSLLLSDTPSPSGVVSGRQPTCLPTCCQLQRRQRQRAYQRRLTPLEKEEKTTEKEAHSSLATVYTCTVPSGRFPAKFGCRPIKLELYLVLHTYTANYVRVHLRHLGVY